MQWLTSQASLICILSKVAQGSLCKQTAARTVGIGMVSLCFSPSQNPKEMEMLCTSEGEWNNGCYWSEKGSCTHPGAAFTLPIAAFHPVAGGEVSIFLSFCSLFQLCLSPILSLCKRCLTKERPKPSSLE